MGIKDSWLRFIRPPGVSLDRVQTDPCRTRCGRPTALGSQLTTLLPDKPTEQAREAMERLVSSGIVERWHVVICRMGGQWLAVAQGPDEIKSLIGSNVACPHCGVRMGEEIQEVAYRLTEAADAQFADNRPLCELLDAALRRARPEAGRLHPM